MTEPQPHPAPTDLDPTAGYVASALLDLTAATGLRITWWEGLPGGEHVPAGDNAPTAGDCGDCWPVTHPDRDDEDDDEPPGGDR